MVKHHGFDRKHGIALEIVPYASTTATKVALQGRAVEAIVTDWIWVSRQRADGADFTFFPYSASIGAILAPAGSEIRTLGDLQGRTLGVAGGPLDKGWLMVQALARRQGIDLAKTVTPKFGAAPLLNALLEKGEIDAVSTFWHFAARLEAKGARRVIGFADVGRELGIAGPVPILGYAFREAWARADPTAARGLHDAIREAKARLAASDEEWQRLKKLTRAKDEATLRALRDGFRAGIPQSWGPSEQADAAKLFAILAEIGGPKLVGKSSRLQAGTFWDQARY